MRLYIIIILSTFCKQFIPIWRPDSVHSALFWRNILEGSHSFLPHHPMLNFPILNTSFGELDKVVVVVVVVVR